LICLAAACVLLLFTLVVLRCPRAVYETDSRNRNTHCCIRASILVLCIWRNQIPKRVFCRRNIPDTSSSKRNETFSWISAERFWFGFCRRNS